MEGFPVFCQNETKNQVFLKTRRSITVQRLYQGLKSKGLCLESENDLLNICAESVTGVRAQCRVTVKGTSPRVRSAGITLQNICRSPRRCVPTGKKRFTTGACGRDNTLGARRVTARRIYDLRSYRKRSRSRCS